MTGDIIITLWKLVRGWTDSDFRISRALAWMVIWIFAGCTMMMSEGMFSDVMAYKVQNNLAKDSNAVHNFDTSYTI